MPAAAYCYASGSWFAEPRSRRRFWEGLLRPPFVIPATGRACRLVSQGTFALPPEHSRDVVAFVSGDAIVGKKLYCGNLSYGTSSGDLDTLFSKFGALRSADVIMDRDTGRSKGFGFVEFERDDDANKAIEGLNGQQHDGRALQVNEAKPREEKRSGGGGYGGGGYGGGGGGGKRRW